MKKDWLVYKVTQDGFSWYVSMFHTVYKQLLYEQCKENKIKRVIIKENLTRTEAYNFREILDKIK